MKLLLVVGARPNFVKAAAIVPALEQHPEFTVELVHTGQHYDYHLSQVFFEELTLPAPRYHLNVGAGTQVGQTAAIMLALESVLAMARPDLLMVVGDTNSALGAGLAGVKSGVPTAHVEAGLRSYDRMMPEEVNRITLDAAVDWWFPPSRDAEAYLLRIGCRSDRVHMIGNVMIDTLLRYLPNAIARKVPARMHLTSQEYAVVTVHRPANTGSRVFLSVLVASLEIVSEQLSLVLPAHPRLQAALEQAGLWERLSTHPRIRLIPPLSYLDFIGLLRDARLVLTDSGGVQEETSVLGVPCLTLRDNTERPITISEGTNRLIGTDPAVLPMRVEEVLSSSSAKPGLPEGWDGSAGARLARVLLSMASTRLQPQEFEITPDLDMRRKHSVAH
jgi:UDP-N-acetylglucosamine 2-epimerase (non-hydrolysing)